MCQICNGRLGRAKQIKENWYCYDCYHELQRKKYHETSKSFATKAEADYYRALEDHYLKPLFYEKESNYDIIQEKRMNVIHAMKKDDILIVIKAPDISENEELKLDDIM